MQDRNGRNWGNGFSAANRGEAVVVDDIREDQPNAAAGDGWQQYRRWISKAPAPRQRRGGIDPSLYTWKGYRTWTEQVKRNWPEKS